MYFLLNTLPEETRENYLNKLRVSRKFWREKGDASVRRQSLSYGRLIFLSLWKNVPLTIRIRNQYGWSISMISIYPGLKKPYLQTYVCLYFEKRSYMQDGFSPDKTREGYEKRSNGQI